NVVQQVLAQLLSSGLLVDGDHLLESLEARHSARDDSTVVESTRIPTKDRPHVLMQCLASYIQNAQITGRPVAFAVSNQTEDRELLATARRLLSAAALRNQVDILHIGPEEKRAFAELLARKGIPAHVATYALLGDPAYNVRAGANRNTLLLSSAGK